MTPKVKPKPSGAKAPRKPQTMLTPNVRLRTWDVKADPPKSFALDTTWQKGSLLLNIHTAKAMHRFLGAWIAWAEHRRKVKPKGRK